MNLDGLPFAVNSISLYGNLNNESTVWNCLDSKNEQLFSPISHKEQQKKYSCGERLMKGWMQHQISE